MKSRIYPLTISQEKDFLDKIINAKKFSKDCDNKGEDVSLCRSCNKCFKGILARKKSTLNNNYDNYDIENASCQIDDISKDACKSLYTNPTKPLKELKKKIETLYTTKCPFCGIIHWSSYDHYLPKDIIPEYSVLGKNLIPSCTVCNSKKGTIMYNEDNERFLLNPYFDEISNSYLLVDINLSTKKVIFKYAENTPPIFKRHFKRLDLFKRYSSEANSKVSEFIHEIKAYKGHIPKATQLEILNTQLQLAEEKYGINNWEVVLKKELIQKFDEI